MEVIEKWYICVHKSSCHFEPSFPFECSKLGVRERAAICCCGNVRNVNATESSDFKLVWRALTLANKTQGIRLQTLPKA